MNSEYFNLRYHRVYIAKQYVSCWNIIFPRILSQNMLYIYILYLQLRMFHMLNLQYDYNKAILLMTRFIKCLMFVWQEILKWNENLNKVSQKTDDKRDIISEMHHFFAWKFHFCFKICCKNEFDFICNFPAKESNLWRQLIRTSIRIHKSWFAFFWALIERPTEYDYDTLNSFFVETKCHSEWTKE